MVACETGQGGWSQVGICRSTSCVRGDTLMIPGHYPSRCAAPGRVESELVRLPGKALIRDTTRRLRFVVHAASWLQYMVLHGRADVVYGGALLHCCDRHPLIVCWFCILHGFYPENLALFNAL